MVDMLNYQNIDVDELSTAEILEKIIDSSSETFDFWQSPYGWAPPNVANMLSVARLDWLFSLTECLKIWVSKDITITDGELLLARANLGSLVEGWLKLFYCVFYNDYDNSDNKYYAYKKGIKTAPIKPPNLSFEQLRQFSNDILWDKGDGWNEWVKSVQRKRNAIHSFNDKDIGTCEEFISDVRKFYSFIKMIIFLLPRE